MASPLEVIVVGAGQAGLAASFHLSRRGIEHVVLERGRVAETWRSRRWDSFTLVGPNWSATLPGQPYTGDDPDGFMSREALVSFFTGYAARIGAPVREGVAVERVRHDPSAEAFTLQTSAGEMRARNVIAATGAYQRPAVPANGLDRGIATVHTAEFRSQAQLPPGGVLVVGSGQSGAQIAEDLVLGGRDVWLSSGSCGWIPRRYRGLDNVVWRRDMGLFEQTIETLPLSLRFSAPPLQTGRGGGHDISLRTLAALGVRVLGRFVSAEGSVVTLADDVERNVRKSDEAATSFRTAVDAFVAERGAAAPEEAPLDTTMPPVDRSTRLELGRAGIRSVIWGTGWAHDYGWIDHDFCGERGYPRQHRGVTEIPGLYVLGLQLMWARKSGLIFGVGDDAAYLADHIAARRST